MKPDIAQINQQVEEQSRFVDQILGEVSKVIVGQRYMLERILIGILQGGHVLLEGVPGLAKTLTVQTFSRVIQASFARLQFTPDLLPADLTGTMIYDANSATFNAKQGPIFANLVLADEINRAPAKVQSALLEAMQEHQVTIGGTSYKLPEPFLVFATQNPIEQQGTYPLPEAQVDRFMLKIKVGYPTKEEERQIVERMARPHQFELEQVITPQRLMAAREVVNQVYVDEKVTGYILDIVFASRDPEGYGIADAAQLIEYGASPRASIYLTQAARAHAFLRHRGYVTPEDVKAVAHDILRHRIIVSYEAEAEQIDSERIIEMIFDHVEVP
ncbi:MAG: MoxR family ATPase [Candidatus Alcyoniella australis]|nr:MoxR family ATPase [Candidatus Alcyoniella australis]